MTRWARVAAAGVVLAQVVGVVARVGAATPQQADSPAVAAPASPAALSEVQRLTALIVQQQQTIARLELQVGELRAALARVEISRADANLDTLGRAYVTALGGSYDAGDRVDWETLTLRRAGPPRNADPSR